jgi:retron-type reverse transcriptase
MEQKQFISYQLELFDINGQGVVYPFLNREAVCGAQGIKDLQVNSAGKHERALVCNLMDIVISAKNVWSAYKQIKQNKGAGGIDGMQVEDFALWFKEQGSTLIEELRSGNYHPQAVRLVEIPKPNGGFRKLGIPTVKDRVIQQAISQVLSPLYERAFSDSSYGFRPNRNAHQALHKASEYVSSGRTVVVDIDLQNFFRYRQSRPLNVPVINQNRGQNPVKVDKKILTKRNNDRWDSKSAHRRHATGQSTFSIVV